MLSVVVPLFVGRSY